MFIESFRHYLKSRTDAPPDFHIHAAMSALAYAMGSNVYCDGWGRPIHPNIWAIIIAPSGYGKSVPLDMAEAIVRKAGVGGGILPGSFSQEALLSQLGKTPTSIFFLQEFSAFIRGLEREYNAGATAWLTELYDVPSEYTRMTMKQGEAHPTTLKKPCITILGASSPAWFSETFKEGHLSGGFLARFLFCPSTDVGDYVGHPGPRDDGIEATLAAHLQMVSKLSGKFDLSAVKQQFDDWDFNFRKNLRHNCLPEFSGMRSRAGMMVLKAAMIWHVSAEPTDLVITTEDMDKAIKYVEWSIGKAEKYLTEEVARDKFEDERMKLIEVLARAGGGMPRAKAMMNGHLSAQQMDRAIETLVQTERLIVETGSSKGKDYLSLPEHKAPVPHSNGVAH